MKTTATNRTHQPIWVGRMHQLQVGDSILPRFESSAHNGIVNMVAARGVVSAASDWTIAAHQVIRDVVRHTLGAEAFIGHVASHKDPTTNKCVLSASSRAKEIIIAHAAQHDGLAGYIYEVEGDFEPATSHIPQAWWAVTSVQVIASTELYFDELEKYFGPGLSQLSDPLSYPTVERDIRSTLNSGLLSRQSL